MFAGRDHADDCLSRVDSGAPPGAAPLPRTRRSGRGGGAGGHRFDCPAGCDPLTARQHRAASGRAEARTCYDHLAGRRGVEPRDHLLAAGAIRLVDDRDHELTDRGDQLLIKLGVDPAALRATRRIFARCRIDGTGRRPHLAGALPAAITAAFLDRKRLTRGPGRSPRVADGYYGKVNNWLAA